MKKILTILLLACLTIDAWAVLKEENLEQTLGILRTELTAHYQELAKGAGIRRAQNDTIISQLIKTTNRANQNALMLYSQNADYVFDLTYACHEATNQYRSFQQQQLPFRKHMEKADAEIAKYDSLAQSLQTLRTNMLSAQAQKDRSICLTLAVNIASTLREDRDQMEDYIEIYQRTENRLKQLNDYALKRYNDIQTSIFKNGGDNYFSILSHISRYWKEMRQTVKFLMRDALGVILRQPLYHHLIEEETTPWCEGYLYVSLSSEHRREGCPLALGHFKLTGLKLRVTCRRDTETGIIATPGCSLEAE